MPVSGTAATTTTTNKNKQQSLQLTRPQKLYVQAYAIMNCTTMACIITAFKALRRTANFNHMPPNQLGRSFGVPIAGLFCV
jgi:hypothetical protein